MRRSLELVAGRRSCDSHLQVVQENYGYSPEKALKKNSGDTQITCRRRGGRFVL